MFDNPEQNQAFLMGGIAGFTLCLALSSWIIPGVIIRTLKQVQDELKAQQEAEEEYDPADEWKRA